MIHIFVISDGTGQIAKQMLQAALTPLPSKEFRFNLFPNIHKEIHHIINQAAIKKIIAFHFFAKFCKRRK